MSVLLTSLIAFGAPLTALGLHDLQSSLERWDYERHAED